MWAQATRLAKEASKSAKPLQIENSYRSACQPISTITTRSNPHMSVRPGPGRKSKGDRDNFAVKPMRPVGDVIRANADRLGMTYGEYCAAILSDALGMPEYAPQPIAPQQQELPLKTA